MHQRHIYISGFNWGFVERKDSVSTSQGLCPSPLKLMAEIVDNTVLTSNNIVTSNISYTGHTSLF